jgi:outer membrane protein assembly factor BamB
MDRSFALPLFSDWPSGPSRFLVNSFSQNRIVVQLQEAMMKRLAAYLASLLTVAFLAAPAAAVPVLKISPNAGHPKLVTLVSGTGFAAGEVVDIYFDTTDKILVFTDAAGKFGSHELDIPSDALPGTHWVTAIGRKNGDGTQNAFRVFTAWNRYTQGNHGGRHNAYENVIDSSNVASLELMWSVALSAAASASASYNGNIYTADGNGKVYEISPTGTIKWTATTGGGIFATPTIAGRDVYVGSDDDKIYAFDAATGSTVWTFTTGNVVLSSPVVVSGILYAGSNDHNVYALNATTGAAAWAAPAILDGTVVSSPAVVGGVVYVGSTGGKFYALDAKTGAQVWAAPFVTGGPITSSPAVVNGIVFIASEDHSLYALNAITGTKLWSQPTTGFIDASPAVANGIVYIDSDDGKLYAFHANTGTLLWSVTGGPFSANSSPAVANGVVYIGDNSTGEVYAFSATTGQFLWSALTGAGIDSSPTVVDGMVLVTSADKHLYAYALDGGNNAAYRRKTSPPSYASLHPDKRLKLTQQ